jgi:hypothetical protein
MYPGIAFAPCGDSRHRSAGVPPAVEGASRPRHTLDNPHSPYIDSDAVDTSALERLYSSETDDELLAIAVERKSLEQEAQSVLWAELRRRKLTDPRLLHPPSPPEAPQNPAFNIPAKVAAIIMGLMLAGLSLALIVAIQRAHAGFKFALVFVLLWGSIFAALAWATRRALRNHSLKR